MYSFLDKNINDKVYIHTVIPWHYNINVTLKNLKADILYENVTSLLTPPPNVKKWGVGVKYVLTPRPPPNIWVIVENKARHRCNVSIKN